MTHNKLSDGQLLDIIEAALKNRHVACDTHLQQQMVEATSMVQNGGHSVQPASTAQQTVELASKVQHRDRVHAKGTEPSPVGTSLA